MGIMVDSPVWVMQDLSHCHYQQGRAESGLCGYLSSIFFLGLSSALRPHALGESTLFRKDKPMNLLQSSQFMTLHMP